MRAPLIALQVSPRGVVQVQSSVSTHFQVHILISIYTHTQNIRAWKHVGTSIFFFCAACTSMKGTNAEETRKGGRRPWGKTKIRPLDARTAPARRVLTWKGREDQNSFVTGSKTAITLEPAGICEGILFKSFAE